MSVVVRVFTVQNSCKRSWERKRSGIPDGKGEKDCNMFSRGGRDDDCNNSVKSGEGRIHMWGLRDVGRDCGAML